MLRPRRAAAALGIAALFCPLPSHRVHAGDADLVTREPYAGWLPGATPDTRTVFVVLDARTGEPLEGVRVRRCHEPDLSPDGTWGPTRAEGTTDRFGLVSFDLAASGGATSSHWTFDRAGYAPDERFGIAVQDTMTLSPGGDLHGRLLAPMGGPAAGVVVEWSRGCEHAPALRRAVTDADGRYVIPCSAPDGELSFEGTGVRARRVPASSALARTAEGVRPMRMSPASALVGRVVAADGREFAGGVVLVGDSGRGPRASVASDGAFRVEGGASFAPLRLVRGLDETISTLTAGTVRPGGPFVWDLRRPSEPVALVDIVVRVTCRGDARPPIDVERIDVRLDSTIDGRRVATTAQPEGEHLVARMRVRPGRHALSAASMEWVSRDTPEDGPFGRWAAFARTVEIGGSTPNPLELTLDEQPAVRVVASDGAGPLRVHESFELVTPIGSPMVGIDVHTPNLRIPADLEGVVWTRRGPFPIGPARDGARTAAVDARPDATLRLRDIAHPEDIRVDDAPVEWEWSDTFAEVRFIGAPGRHRVMTTDADGGRAFVDVEVPAGPGAVVEVASAAWKRPARADVVVAALPGERPPRVDVFVRTGHEETIAEPLAGGIHRSPALTEGAWIRLEADGHAPHRTQLLGAGPWRVAFGSSTLVVRVRGEAATDVLDALVDGWTPSSTCWTHPDAKAGPTDARLTVRGLAPGVHTVLVGGVEHGVVALRVRVADGATQTIDVDLPAR